MPSPIFTPALGAFSTVQLPLDTPELSLHFNCSFDAGLSIPEIWTNLPSQSWQAVAFRPDSTSPSNHTAEIPIVNAEPGSFEYTFRLRHEDGRIDWLGSEGSNGRVELLPSQAANIVPTDCPLDFSNASLIRIHDRVTHAEFKLEDGASGDFQSFPIGHGHEWSHSSGFVIERSERTWYQPRILNTASPIADISTRFETGLLYLRTNPTAASPTARIAVVFPFSSSSVSSSLFGGEDSLWLRCTRDTSTHDVAGHVVVAHGVDGELQILIDACVKVAGDVLSAEASSTKVGTNAKIASTSLAQLQGLSACTWNALNYDKYKLSEVLPWVEGLKDPKRSSPLIASSLDTVLLDDGWQDIAWFKDSVDGVTGRRALRSFGVKPDWYDVKPHANGTSSKDNITTDSGYASSSSSLTGHGQLADAVSRIKAYGIKRVGVWMTLEGYWDGLAPEGPIADRYRLKLWELKDEVHSQVNTHWYLPAIEDLSDFYQTYFQSLKDAGVDFVKIDDQAHQDYLRNADVSESGDAGLLRQAMLQTARQTADDIFGGGTTIHCMAGSPRIWGGALALDRAGPKDIIRASDDYFPDQIESHTWHIFTNAYNTLLLRSLHLIPDFDMCQASHEYGMYHIALRAFTPSATYTTDLPSHQPNGDEHRLVAWDAMLASTKRNGAKLVKSRAAIGAVLEGRICQDVRSDGDGEALTLGLTLEEAAGGHIGMWNCRAGGGTARTTIDARDVADVTRQLTGDAFIAHIDGQVKRFDSKDIASSSASHRLLAKPAARVELAQKEVKIAAIAQLHTLPSTAADSTAFVHIACLGLLDKHVGLAAISSISVKSAADLTTTTPPPSTDTIESMSRSQVVSRIPPPSAPFPRPLSSRLAFLLTCLTSFRAASSPASTSAQRESRTIRSETSSLAHDLLRRPLSTVWSETRALVGFTLAVVLWSLGQLKGGLGGLRGRSIDDRMQEEEDQAEPARVGAVETESTTGQRLAVELLFVSARLGFYVSGCDVSSFSFCLDGHKVDERFVRAGASDGLIEVDVEGAWKATGSNADSDSWLVEVECRGS